MQEFNLEFLKFIKHFAQTRNFLRIHILYIDLATDEIVAFVGRVDFVVLYSDATFWPGFVASQH